MTQKLSASTQAAATAATSEAKAQAGALSAQAMPAAGNGTALTEEKRKLLADEKARQEAAAREAAAKEKAASEQAAAETAASGKAAETAPAEGAAATAAPAGNSATTAADPLADTIAKAEAGASAGSAPAATGASTAAAGASGGFSPWLIGAGVLGAVGVGVAASNSDDDNGNTSQTQGATTQPASGAGSTTGTTTTGDATTGTTTGTSTDGSSGTTDTGSNTPPPAADPTAQTVTVAANSADVQLAASHFDGSAPNAQFIQITNIESSEGANLDARVYRDTRVTVNGQETDRHTAYEVIQAPQGVTWEEASAMAERLGGKLLVINDQAEAEFIRDNLSSRLGSTPENFEQLSRGAWIGLQQAAGQASADEGWRWADGTAFSAQDWATFGANIGGVDNIPTDGATSGRAEGNNANHAAIIEGWNTTTNSLSSNMIYDYGGKLNSFVVEYESAGAARPFLLQTANGLVAIQEGQVIGREDFDKLRWNSLFSSHGKIEYVAVDGWENPQTVTDAKPVTLTLNEGGTTAPGTAGGATASSTGTSATISALLGVEEHALT